MRDDTARQVEPAACPTEPAHDAHAADRTVVCHVGPLTDPDLDVVHALARLHVAARRHGRTAVLCHAPPALVDLIQLTGLSGVLQVTSGVEAGRQPEQREQPVGAEKRVHRLDLAP